MTLASNLLLELSIQGIRVRDIGLLPHTGHSLQPTVEDQRKRRRVTSRDFTASTFHLPPLLSTLSYVYSDIQEPYDTACRYHSMMSIGLGQASASRRDLMPPIAVLPPFFSSSLS